jgi:N-acetylneuraminic acid mutarotase
MKYVSFFIALMAVAMSPFMHPTGNPAVADSLTWSRLAPLPDERGVAGVFAGVSGRDPQSSVLVVAGGANFPGQPPWAGGTKTWHAAAYVLPKPDGAWRIAAPLPRPLGYGVSVSYGGRVWCVGGGDATEHVRSKG